MVQSIQMRRGSNTNRSSYTLLSGEPGWATDTKVLFMGDGSTVGGIQVAMYSDISNILDGTTDFSKIDIVRSDLNPALSINSQAAIIELTATESTNDNEWWFYVGHDLSAVGDGAIGFFDNTNSTIEFAVLPNNGGTKVRSLVPWTDLGGDIGSETYRFNNGHFDYIKTDYLTLNDEIIASTTAKNIKLASNSKIVEQTSTTTYNASNDQTYIIGSNTSDSVNNGQIYQYKTKVTGDQWRQIYNIIGNRRVDGELSLLTLSDLGMSVESGYLTSGNIKIDINTISTTNTDGNLIFEPNGAGIIQPKASYIPDSDNVYDIGSETYNLKNGYFTGVLDIGSLKLNSSEIIDSSGNATLENITSNGDIYLHDDEATTKGIRFQRSTGTSYWMSHYSDSYIGLGHDGSTVSSNNSDYPFKLELSTGNIFTNTIKPNTSNTYSIGAYNSTWDEGHFRKLGIGGITPVSHAHIYQNTTDTGTGTGLTIEQDGSGDSQLQWLLTGGQRWVAGIDNSDSDKLKIGRGTDWGTGVDLEINTSGDVTVNNDFTAESYTKIAARLTSNQSLTDATWTTLQLSNEITDRASEYNTGTYTFTADKAGRYLISGTVQFDANANGIRIVRALVNGTDFNGSIASQNTTSTGDTYFNVSFIVDLSATNTVVIQAYQNSGDSLDVDSTYTEINISRLV